MSRSTPFSAAAVTTALAGSGLITASVDMRAAVGRLGHSGGGATTLRVYAASLNEADQQAASRLEGRIPAAPKRKWAA